MSIKTLSQQTISYANPTCGWDVVDGNEVFHYGDISRALAVVNAPSVVQAYRTVLRTINAKARNTNNYLHVGQVFEYQVTESTDDMKKVQMFDTQTKSLVQTYYFKTNVLVAKYIFSRELGSNHKAQEDISLWQGMINKIMTSMKTEQAPIIHPVTVDEESDAPKKRLGKLESPRSIDIRNTIKEYFQTNDMISNKDIATDLGLNSTDVVNATAKLNRHGVIEVHSRVTNSSGRGRKQIIWKRVE